MTPEQYETIKIMLKLLAVLHLINALLVVVSTIHQWEWPWRRANPKDRVQDLREKIAHIEGKKAILERWADTEKQREAEQEKIRQQIEASNRRIEHWKAQGVAAEKQLEQLWKRAPATLVTPPPSDLPSNPAELKAEQAVIRHLQRERPLMLTAGPARSKARRRLGLSKSQRFAIFKRDRYRCQICGAYASDDLTLEVDHKIAVAKGGTNDSDNLWTLCWDCNRGKSDSDL